MGVTGLEPVTGKVVAPAPQQRQKRRYFPEGYYSMHADAEVLKLATNRRLPAATRLLFLCVARANVWGHASFRPPVGRKGEMLQLLGCDGKTQNKALEALKAAQVIAPDSTIECVVLNALFHRRADRQRTLCAEPEHEGRRNLMWTGSDGWEEVPGEWQAILQSIHAPVRRTRRRVRRVVEEVEEIVEEG